MTDLAEALIVIEELCEHGRLHRHVLDYHCPGGSRRVVSGTPIRWCEEHDLPMMRDGGCEDAKLEWTGDRSTAGFNCRIVDRILIDPGGIE